MLKVLSTNLITLAQNRQNGVIFEVDEKNVSVHFRNYWGNSRTVYLLLTFKMPVHCIMRSVYNTSYCNVQVYTLYDVQYNECAVFRVKKILKNPCSEFFGMTPRLRQVVSVEHLSC